MAFEHSNPFQGPNPFASPEPASQSPLMVYQGQMWSREMAERTRDEKMAQPEYAKAFENNDSVRLTELKDLYMLARGLEPSAPPQTQVDVGAEMVTREQRDVLRHDAVLQQQFDLTDQQRHEIIHQCPILQWEKDEMAAKHSRNMASKDFRQRLAERDPAAVSDAFKANWISRAPLARSMADIDAWNARFPFKPKASAAV